VLRYSVATADQSSDRSFVDETNALIGGRRARATILGAAADFGGCGVIDESEQQSHLDYLNRLLGRDFSGAQPAWF
jgi:hypothetical protein